MRREGRLDHAIRDLHPYAYARSNPIAAEDKSGTDTTIRDGMGFFLRESLVWSQLDPTLTTLKIDCGTTNALRVISAIHSAFRDIMNCTAGGCALPKFKARWLLSLTSGRWVCPEGLTPLERTSVAPRNGFLWNGQVLANAFTQGSTHALSDQTIYESPAARYSAFLPRNLSSPLLADQRPGCLKKSVAHEALHTVFEASRFNELFPFPANPPQNGMTRQYVARFNEETYIPMQVLKCVHCW